MKIKPLLQALALSLAALTSAAPPSANAAAINWGPATTISADSDIFNVGSLNYAYNQSNTATTVNGVLFAAGGNATSLGGGNVTMSGFNGGVYTGFGNPTGLSTNYSILTNSATYVNSASSTTVNLNNLAASHVYAAQIWVNDSRVSGANRTETVTSAGGNTITLDYNSTEAAGGAGQYSIGGFTADATTQALTMLGNASTQLNALQVRDVTGVWSGAGGGSWADGSAGFTANNTWSTVSGLIGGNGTVTFADTDGFKTAVTNSTISVQSGGVSAGTVIFQNSSLAYTISNASGTTGITGSTALVKTGTGTLTLSSANTYTGGTSLNGGTIQIGDASALGTSGTLSFGGGTLLYGTGITTDLSARFSNAASQNYRIDTNGNNVTYATALTSSGGSFTKSGTGNLTLTGVNTYSGGTTINGGTLIFQNTNGSAVAPVTGAIINNANLVYTLTANSTASYSFNVPGGSGISGSGNLSMSIATVGPTQQGYLQFPTGNVTQGGSLTFSQTGTVGYLNGFALVSTANATSSLKGSSITMSGEIGVGSPGSRGYLSLDTSATNGTINLDVSLGVSGRWYTPQGLTANAGTGTINVNGTTYGNSGWTTSGGTGNSLTGALQISATNFTTNDKLALHATAASSVTGNVTLAGTANTITVDNGVTMSVSGQFKGSGAGYTKDGSGTLTLSGNNTYTGGTTINGGTLNLQNTNGSVVAPGTGAITNNANLVYTLTGNSSGAYSFTVPNGSGISGSGNLSMSIATVGTQAGYLQFPNGNVTQGGSLTFAQTGSTGSYLQGFALVNTTNATTTLKGSSIIMSGEIGNISTQGRGYLALDTSATNGPIGLDVSLGVGSRWWEPQGLTANAGTGTISVNGTSYGNNGWSTRGGTGSSLTGALQISASNFTTTDTLALHATAASSVTGNLTLAAKPNTITVDNGVAMLVSGKLKGSGAGFTKDGTGTLRLTGANTYNGTTTVTAGTLVLDGGGSLASGASVTVNGGTFGGNGTVGGAVTVASGATLQAGASLADTGTLTISGNLSLSPGSIVSIGLGAGASTHDVLALNTSATFQTNQAFSFLDQGTIAGTTYISIVTGLSPSLDVSAWSVSNSGWTGTFTNNAGSIDFALATIPEPGTWILVGIGLTFILHRKRRRFDS